MDYRGRIVPDERLHSSSYSQPGVRDVSAEPGIGQWLRESVRRAARTPEARDRLMPISTIDHGPAAVISDTDKR